MAAMIDDHLMEITHVIAVRSAFHFPLHVNIIRAFVGGTHLGASLRISQPSGKGKMSKREAADTIKTVTLFLSVTSDLGYTLKAFEWIVLWVGESLKMT